MISEQVNLLRRAVIRLQVLELPNTANEVKVAADTIEELSAKLANANMERSVAYYNDGWIPVSEFMPADLGEDWVQVQIQEADTGFLWIPRTAEHRNGKWWLTDSDEPLYDVFEVVAWRRLPPCYRPKGE